MADRLRDALSPYLRQHAGHPVDWWPWGDEAFAEAARRQVPVFISVGYAACHWCHVMARESFEDPRVAAFLNEHYVPIKVDREERPDVDAAYMSAVQALTGQGGWPMSVFATPDGEPFYTGTYFPPRPAHGRSSFRQVLEAVHTAWERDRGNVQRAAGELTATLAAAVPPGEDPDRVDADTLSAAVQTLAAAEDRVHGGFGGAPKFPPSTTLDWLVRHAATGAPTAGQARGLAERTCAAMARSGMYDQLAGGFARYSVDEAWVVPHFEKMLYDNALLARGYLHLWRLTGDPEAARVAVETCDFLLAGLGTPEGGFGSSLDADTDGREGATYVWSRDEIVRALGDGDGTWAAELLGVTAEGGFGDGRSTLRLTRPVFGTRDEGRWRRLRGVLLDVRARRPQPSRDDKVVLGWNAFAVTVLAEAGALLDRPDLLRAAAGCAALLIRVHRRPDGSWVRVSRDGVAGDAPAVLADVAALLEALVVLAGVTGTRDHDTLILELSDALVTTYRDGQGRFVDVDTDREDPRLAALGTRGDLTDAAVPSGPAAAARALLMVATLTEQEVYAETAQVGLHAAGAFGRRAPSFVAAGLSACEGLLDGPARIVVVGEGPQADALHRTALAATVPGAVVLRCAPGERPFGVAPPPLPQIPAAYVCRGGVCRAPVTTAGELAGQVGARC